MFSPYQQPWYPQPMPDQLSQLRMQQAPQMQPMPQMPQQPPQTGSFFWVSDEAAAVNWPMPPNSAITFFHTSLPEVYMKKTDPSGKPGFEAYTLVKRSELPQERAEPAPVPAVSREEFEALRQRVSELGTEKRPAKKKEAEEA